MARVEDFLNEARAEALALLQDDAERRYVGTGEKWSPDTALSGPSRDWASSAGRSNPPRGPVTSRAHFEDSVRLGIGPAMSGGRDALASSATGRGDSRPLPEALRGLTMHTDQSRRGVEPNARLQRIGACLSATADLVADLSAEEKRRVHDHVGTTLAHVARISAATQTRPGPQHEATRRQLTKLAQEVDSRRTTAVPHDLGESGMVGVPGTPLEQSLSRWRGVSREALTPTRLADSANTAREVATTGAQISAAAYRACLTQEGPAMKDLAERWKVQAVAWREAGSAWRPPPMLVSGAVRPDAELVAASRDVRERIAGEFRDTNLVWVPPERLADPAALRRFEYDARQTMAELGAKYHDAVGSLARSEVVAIPVAQLTRLEGGQGFDPETTLGSRSWTTLPATDPAALRLTETAAQVEVASLHLNRPGPAAEPPPPLRGTPGRDAPQATRDRSTRRGPSQEPGRE